MSTKAETGKRRSRTRLVIGLLCSIVAAAIPVAATPGFLSVAQSFGIELPVIARLFVDHGAVFWVLPVLVLLAWFKWPNPKRRGLIAMLIGMLALAVIAPIAFFVLYLPVLQLGASG